MVFFGGEPRQSILIHKAVQLRRYLRYKNINSKVEFSLVDQVRERFVLLYHVALVAWDVADLLRQENALTLTAIDRLHNKRHRLLALHEIYELV